MPLDRPAAVKWNDAASRPDGWVMKPGTYSAVSRGDGARVHWVLLEHTMMGPFYANDHALCGTYTGGAVREFLGTVNCLGCLLHQQGLE